METRPRDPTRGVRPGARVIVLGVVQSGQRLIAAPLVPTRGLDHAIQVGLHDNRPRIVLPRPTEVGLGSAVAGRQVSSGTKGAIVKRRASNLVRVSAALSGDRIELALEGEARVDVARLEDDGGVAKDEVNGAVDVAFAVELAVGVGVEGVLVGLEAAPEEGGEVGAAAERNGLAFARPRRVSDRQVHGEEALPRHDCKLCSN